MVMQRSVKGLIKHECHSFDEIVSENSVGGVRMKVTKEERKRLHGHGLQGINVDKCVLPLFPRLVTFWSPPHDVS